MPRPDHEYPDNFAARLESAAPLRLRGARGQRVRVDAGCVWITVEGLADDVFLHAGEMFRIPGDGLTLIEALGSAGVSLLAETSLAGEKAAQKHGEPDLVPVGRIKSTVSFRWSTALRVPVLAALCGLLRSP